MPTETTTAETGNNVANAVGNVTEQISQSTETTKTELLDSFNAAYEQVIVFAPRMIAAALVLILGYIISKFVARGVTALCERIGMQRGAERGGLLESMDRIGIKKTVPEICGLIVFWLMMGVFLMAGLNILGLDRLSEVMEGFVSFIPQVLVATVLVVVGLLMATLLRGVVATSADRVGLSYASQLANGVYFALVVTTMIIALGHLGIETQFVQWLILISAGGAAIGFALAFGLGGRDVVGGILAGYYIRQRMQSGDEVTIGSMAGTVREVGPVATIIETEEEGLMHRHSVPNIKMLNEAVR